MACDPQKLTDADLTLLRQCPVRQFVPKRGARLAAKARLVRINRLTYAGLVHGVIIRSSLDGMDMEISLTRAGRIALGLPPDAPLPEPPVKAWA